MPNQKLDPYDNLNIIDQTKCSFPVDHLTKLSLKEDKSTIQRRLVELYNINWLYDSKTIL